MKGKKGVSAWEAPIRAVAWVGSIRSGKLVRLMLWACLVYALTLWITWMLFRPFVLPICRRVKPYLKRVPHMARVLMGRMRAEEINMTGPQR